nr:hypothetical protein [Dyadobacter fermentans]
MKGRIIGLKLKNDQKSLRKAAERAAEGFIEFAQAAEAFGKAAIETHRKLAEGYCRAIGKLLVLSVYDRIIWTYPAYSRRSKKNTRLQRVARQGAAAAAARLSILSDLRQKRAFGRGRSGRPHYTFGGWRLAVRPEKPSKSLQAMPYD